MACCSGSSASVLEDPVSLRTGRRVRLAFPFRLLVSVDHVVWHVWHVPAFQAREVLTAAARGRLTSRSACLPASVPLIYSSSPG